MDFADLKDALQAAPSPPRPQLPERDRGTREPDEREHRSLDLGRTQADAFRSCRRSSCARPAPPAASTEASAVSSSVAPLVPIRDVDLAGRPGRTARDRARTSTKPAFPDLRYPITVHLADGSQQATVASVVVRGQRRGRHARRPHEPLRREPARLAQPHRRLDALGTARGTARATRRTRRRSRRFDFPLFLERTGPVSGGGALVAYDCSLEGQLGARASECTLTTRVPVTSLCPCSREISDYGAHNQRGSVEISVDLRPDRRR